MSSNYTGDPTATQSPGPTPGYGNYPIVVLPADGDALNAASVAQAYKELADFVAFAQQKIGYLYAARTRWLGTSAAPLPSSGWALSAAAVTGYLDYFCTTANGVKLTFDIPLAYSATSYEKLTSVSVKMYKDSTNNAVVTVSNLTGISGSNVVALSTIATGSSATNSEQVITVGSLTASAGTNNSVVVSVVAADVNDRVYGISYVTTETAV